MTLESRAPVGLLELLLRPSPARVAECRVSGARLVAIASDFAVTVPLPPGVLTRATWRVYDSELNVLPMECDPRAPGPP